MATEIVDVLVIGGGAAGLATAVAAAREGAQRVVVLEKGTDLEAGGNTRFSHAGFRFTHDGPAEIREFLSALPESTFKRLILPPYTHEAYLDDLGLPQETSGESPLRTLVADSNAAMHWMLDLGFAMEPNVHVERSGEWHFELGCPLQTRGGRRGGAAQIARWLELAASHGVEIRYGSPVGAIHGSAGRVDEVTVQPFQGDPYSIDAGAVVLAAGGFQANRRMRQMHLGLEPSDGRVRGTRHDTGEVLEMALGIGAAASGRWSDAAVTPVSASAPEVEASNQHNRYRYPFGVTVNVAGRRFLDEGAGTLSATYGEVGWAILQQPGSIAFQIFDDGAGTTLLDDSGYRGAPYTSASSVADLARKSGIDEVGLTATLSAYNDACVSDKPFDPTRLDGRATAGVDPPKSNWAVPIMLSPFRSYAVTGGFTFTYGGLKTDASGRVLNRSGSPIEGLYANGDIMGLFEAAYPAMAGQTRNVVFGRRIGEAISLDRVRSHQENH